jgi:hypothetical protein
MAVHRGDRWTRQEEVHKLIHDHGFTIANLSSRLSESGQSSNTA